MNKIVVDNIPIYKDGEPWLCGWDKLTTERSCELNYFKNLDDIKIYFNNLIDYEKDYNILNFYNDIKNQIQTAVDNNVNIKFLLEDYRNQKLNINYTLKDYPYDLKQEWIIKLKPLNDINLQNLKMKNKYIVDNLVEVYKVIDDLISAKQTDIKNKIKETNHKYYMIKKKLLNIPTIIKKTEEEKKEAKMIANKKYHSKKQNELSNINSIVQKKTEEEKKEAKKIANKKYHLKQKQLKEQQSAI